MTGRHGKNPERWKPSETHADSSSQHQTGGDAHQWQAQQMGGDATWSNQTGLNPQEYSDHSLMTKQYSGYLQEADRKNKERVSWFAQEPSGDRIPSRTPLDKRAYEARYRAKAVKQGLEIMQARATRGACFDPTEQAQIVQEQLEKFKQTQLERARQAQLEREQQAQLEWAQQAQPPLYAPEPVWQAQPPEFNPAQPPFNPEPVWPAPQPELTSEQQAQQAQYLLEQQAQRALEQMRQGQPPYPEYPRQGGGFQQ